MHHALIYGSPKCLQSGMCVLFPDELKGGDWTWTKSNSLHEPGSGCSGLGKAREGAAHCIYTCLLLRGGANTKEEAIGLRGGRMLGFGSFSSFLEGPGWPQGGWFAWQDFSFPRAGRRYKVPKGH